MASDGSDLGIDADRALKTILGGEPAPEDDERQTPQQVEARVAAARPDSYGGATDCITRAVLRLFAQRPETRAWPTDPSYDHSKTPSVMLGPDLFGATKEVADDAESKAIDGCTGFMWGFAVNQARWLFSLPTHGNPAIISLASDV